MSLIGNVDTPASYVADYMQACVGMFGIPAGGFVSDIETFGASNGYDVESLYAAMLNSTIGRSIYAPGISSESFATKLVDKVGGGLLSDADKAAAIDEVQALLDGGLSHAATAMAVVEFVAGLETSDATYGAVAQQFANRIEIANYYTFSSTSPSSTLSTLTAVLSTVNNTTDVTDPAAVLDSISDPGVSTGQTYTLTSSVDTIVGTSSADIINGSNTSTTTVLGGLDSIDGGAGTDTVNITDTTVAATAAFTLPTGFTVKNVETLNVTANGSIGDAAATAFDVSGMTGLTTFKATSAGDGTKNHSIKAATTTAVDLTVSAGTTTVNGGSSVAIKGGGAATVNDAAGTNTGTTLTSVSLTSVDANSTVKGGAITTITLGGATTAARTYTVDNATASHALTVNAAGTGYTSAGAAAQTVLVDTVATSATVNTTAKSSLDMSGSTAVKSVTLTGSGALTFAAMGSAVTSIDGSAATGNLSLGTLNAAATTVKTGSGNDTYTVSATTKATVDSGAGNDNVTLAGALASGSSVNLGAGDDHLIGTAVPAYSSSNLSTIDGGDGTDTVSAAMINAGNASQFKNFEGVSLNSTTGMDISLLSGSTITGLYIDAASTTATYQNVTTAMGLTVSYVGTNATTNTLSMTGVTGTSDAYAITFAADNSAATTDPTSANVSTGTIAVAGIENFTIASGGTKAWNSLTLGADSSANTVTITGASNLDLAFAAGFGSTTAPATGVSSIDGSAATGKLAINLANVTPATAGLAVKGGSAADTITSSLTATSLTGGSGADNFVVTSTVAASTSAPVITTITDAAAGDKLTFTIGGTNVFTSAKVDVSTANALFGGTTNALDLAVTAAGNTDNQISWFQYGGNTYVINHTGASTNLDTSDVVVKLTGLIDLSTATFAEGGAAASTLTIA